MPLYSQTLFYIADHPAEAKWGMGQHLDELQPQTVEMSLRVLTHIRFIESC
jgi:hypothetical protein